MSGILPTAVDDTHLSAGSQRNARHAREFWRLAEAMRLVVAKVAKTEVLGEDELVLNLASQYGLGTFDFVPLRVRQGAAYATVIGVPTRVWHHHRSKLQLVLLRSDLKRANYPSFLVAERVWRRQPRLRNLQLLDAASEVVASPTGQLSVLQTVLESGGTSIMDCAKLIDGPRPVEGVLSLIASGHLLTDLTRAIGPMSIVSLPSYEVAP